MGKQKLKRFAEIGTFSNVIQPEFSKNLTEKHALTGNWCSTFFKNNQPLVLELGCGKGEYTVGLAQHFPAKNFIGIDIKGNRIWRGAKTALENSISNAGFLRTRIEFITKYFDKNEVSEIWVTFPDPQPGDRREKKRLTGLLLLKQYIQFLQEDAILHLKTDHAQFFEFTRDLWQELGLEIQIATPQLYAEPHTLFNADEQQILKIKTFYEEKFAAIGHSICYLKARLTEEARKNIQACEYQKKSDSEPTEPSM